MAAMDKLLIVADADAFSVVDVAAGTVIKTIRSPCTPIRVAAAGRRLFYVVGQSDDSGVRGGTLWQGDADMGLVRSIAGSGSARYSDLAISPDGKTLAAWSGTAPQNVALFPTSQPAGTAPGSYSGSHSGPPVPDPRGLFWFVGGDIVDGSFSRTCASLG